MLTSKLNFVCTERALIQKEKDILVLVLDWKFRKTWARQLLGWIQSCCTFYFSCTPPAILTSRDKKKQQLHVILVPVLPCINTFDHCGFDSSMTPKNRASFGSINYLIWPVFSEQTDLAFRGQGPEYSWQNFKTGPNRSPKKSH